MELDHCPPIANVLKEVKEIKEKVKEMAIKRAEYEGLDKDPRLKDPNDHFYNNLAEFAMFKCAYYSCFKCKTPYFGGMADCNDMAMRAGDFRREDLICAKCSSDLVGAGVTKCDKHGFDNIDYKCRYCCSVALWFCGGNTHYCDPCHNDAIARRLKHKDCNGVNCPLGVKHPPAGTEFALGCGLCRSNKYQIDY